MARELTPRERELLRLLGEGKTTSEIAERLDMAESTVIWYVGHLAARIGTRRIDSIAASLAKDRTSRARPSFALPAVALALLLLAGLGAAVVVTGAMDGLHIAPLVQPVSTTVPQPAVGVGHAAVPAERAAPSPSPTASASPTAITNGIVPPTLVPVPTLPTTPTVPPAPTLPPLPTLPPIVTPPPLATPLPVPTPP
jgi:DNA-binding CsgD family transcriptional regulator